MTRHERLTGIICGLESRPVRYLLTKYSHTVRFRNLEYSIILHKVSALCYDMKYAQLNKRCIGTVRFITECKL